MKNTLPLAAFAIMFSFGAGHAFAAGMGGGQQPYSGNGQNRYYQQTGSFNDGGNNNMGDQGATATSGASSDPQPAPTAPTADKKPAKRDSSDDLMDMN